MRVESLPFPQHSWVLISTPTQATETVAEFAAEDARATERISRRRHILFVTKHGLAKECEIEAQKKQTSRM